MRDESRTLGIDIQVWVPNRLWVLQPKVVVLSAKEKAEQISQVRTMKLNESEEPMKRRYK